MDYSEFKSSVELIKKGFLDFLAKYNPPDSNLEDLHICMIYLLLENNIHPNSIIYDALFHTAIYLLIEENKLCLTYEGKIFNPNAKHERITLISFLDIALSDFGNKTIARKI